MLCDGSILDTGYVIYVPERKDFCTANVGIFKTKRRAEDQCNRHNKIYGTKWKVLKVNLVVTQE